MLCHEEQKIDSPVWHEKILKERKKKIESGEAEFFYIEDLKANTGFRLENCRNDR